MRIASTWISVVLIAQFVGSFGIDIINGRLETSTGTAALQGTNFIDERIGGRNVHREKVNVILKSVHKRSEILASEEKYYEKNIPQFLEEIPTLIAELLKEEQIRNSEFLLKLLQKDIEVLKTAAEQVGVETSKDIENLKKNTCAQVQHLTVLSDLVKDTELEKIYDDITKVFPNFCGEQNHNWSNCSNCSNIITGDDGSTKVEYGNSYAENISQRAPILYWLLFCIYFF